jgi:large subunit ribosomal protein L17
MRHSNAGKKFSRTPSHRKALLRNLAKALLSHGKIRTTEIKAKELRGVVEPLITLALRNDLHSRRQAYRVLGDHALVKRLFDEIGPVFAGVPGGYTRVVKLAQPRRGDNAPLAFIELIRNPGEKSAPVKAKEAKPSPAAKPAKTEKPKAAKAKAPKEPAAAEPIAAEPPAATPPAADEAEAPAKPKRTRKKAETAPTE